MNLTLKQAQQIVDFFGDSDEFTVSVGAWPSSSNANPVPGLWCWCTDYPEEGGVPLDDEAIAYEERNYDPSPWCTGCGSMTQKGCDCGPTDPMN